MFIYIMRHGEAEATANSDRERALTAAGQATVRAVGRALQHGVGGVSHILHSPYLRTTQTAALMHEQMGGHAAMDPCAALASGEEAAPALAWLQQNLSDEEDVLLISHVPLVSMLAGLLLEGDPAADHPYHPASVLAIELESPAPGVGELLWCRHPGDWGVA